MYERQGRETTSTRTALRQKSKSERRTEAQNWWKRNVETSGTGAMRCHARQRVVQGDSHRQRGNTSDPTKIHPCSTDGTQEGRDIVSARSMQRRRTAQGDRTHQGDGRGGRWQHAQVEGMRGRRVGEVLAAEREGRIKMCTRGTRSASLCYWERATAMIRWQAGCTQALQRRSNRLPGRWMATRAGGEREGTNAISSVCRTGVVTCRGVGECAIRGMQLECNWEGNVDARCVTCSGRVCRGSVRRKGEY